MHRKAGAGTAMILVASLIFGILPTLTINAYSTGMTVLTMQSLKYIAAHPSPSALLPEEKEETTAYHKKTKTMRRRGYRAGPRRHALARCRRFLSSCGRSLPGKGLFLQEPYAFAHN